MLEGLNFREKLQVWAFIVLSLPFLLLECFKGYLYMRKLKRNDPIVVEYKDDDNDDSE